jgi:hypothetical protein
LSHVARVDGGCEFILADMQARGFRAAERPHPNGALVSDMAILRALDAGRLNRLSADRFCRR